jgi:hypothetical protein
MANNTQIGKYLYSNTDLPLYGKVLSVINESKSGASFVTIAGKQEIVQEFNGDIVRTQGKVKTVLSNLRFRGVANEVNVSHGHNVWRIANKDDALTLIAEAGKIVNKMTQRATDVAAVKSDSVDNEVSNTPKTKKVNTMATKTVSKKAPRLFVNPETSKVEPFGAGRPSKAKLAFECNADGQYLNPQAAMQFAQQGGKSEDKLTKAELIDLLRKVRAERDEAIAARDTLAEVLGEMNKGEVECSEDDDCDELDLDAEAVEGDEESDEVEATEAE